MDWSRRKPEGHQTEPERARVPPRICGIGGSHMSTERLRCAADLPPDISPVALVYLYQRHLLVLTTARAQRMERAPQELVDHALAALSIATALINDLRKELSPIVHDALRRGADPSAVAAAIAVEP